MSKGRLEAFSDGVFAILITIMVLELKTPHEASWHALQHLLPVGVGSAALDALATQGAKRGSSAVNQSQLSLTNCATGPS